MSDENKYFVLAAPEDAISKYWYRATTKEACKLGLKYISEYAPLDKNNYEIREVYIDPETCCTQLLERYRIINNQEQ